MTDIDFNRSELPVVLTIGGSDSGGGAGIQADLKTLSALRVFGTSAITCITAQTPTEVRAVDALSPEIVREQIRSVSNGFPITAAKTGMLYSAEIIRAVAQADIAQGIPILVVDPVMVASSGAKLLQSDAIDALCADLLPLARAITPNVHELEIIAGRPLSNVEDLKKAAQQVGDKYDVACIAKGGDLTGDEVIDVLYDEGELAVFSSPRLDVKETHGCGCTFSAALAGYLAHGELMKDAVAMAKDFVHGALKTSHQVGHHFPLNFFGS